jgi:hypothetical protein
MRFVFGHLFQALCGGHICFSIPPPPFIVTTQIKMKLINYTLAHVGSVCVQLISCILWKLVVGLRPKSFEVSQYRTPSSKKLFALFVLLLFLRSFLTKILCFSLELLVNIIYCLFGFGATAPNGPEPPRSRGF